jgi:hypothetical protein
MTIDVTVHANEDDALIAWRPDPWPDEWVGFMLEIRDLTIGEIRTLNNRIPTKAGQGEVPASGISSQQSPILRCIWTDHRVDNVDQVAYRVTPMQRSGDSSYTPITTAASDWTPPPHTLTPGWGWALGLLQPRYVDVAGGQPICRQRYQCRVLENVQSRT